MTVKPSQRMATYRWRTKLREAGRSWMCITAIHELCSGRVGRLVLRPLDTRPFCTCPCHLEHDELEF